MIHVADYIVFFVVVLFVILQAIFHAFRRGGQRTPNQFFFGGRSLKAVPISASLLVSCMSAVALLGYPGEVYEYGLGYASFILAIVWVYPVAAYVFVPVIRGLRITSCYEYFDLRYNYLSRLVTSALFLILSAFYVGIVMMGPASALATVYGFNAWECVLFVAVICTLYTTLAGVKGIVWTDVVFFAIILITMVIILSVGSTELGGASNIWAYNAAEDRLNFFHVPFDLTERVTFFNCIVGGGINLLALLVTQIMLQRMVSTVSTKETKKAVLLNMPYMCIFQPILYSIGAMVFAYYNGRDLDTIVGATTDQNLKSVPSIVPETMTPTTNPATLASAMIGVPRQEPTYYSSDEVLVFFVRDCFRFMPGFTGLFFSAIFAGTVSLVSSSLSAMAAVTLEDYVKPWIIWRSRGREIYTNDAKNLMKAQIIVVMFGCVSVAFSFLVMSMDSMLEASNIVLGVFGGPLLAAMLMGVAYKRSTGTGVVVGILVGLSMALWVSVGALVHADHLDEVLVVYSLSFMWYGAWAFCVTFIVGVIVSEVHRRSSKQERDADQQLVAIFLREKEKTIKTTEVFFSDKEIEKMLGEADGRSLETIKEARKRKTAKMRSVRKDAAAEIVEYRTEQKRRFENIERSRMCHDDSYARSIEIETRQKIKEADRMFHKKKEMVVDYVLSMVCDISPQVHENYYFVNSCVGDYDIDQGSDHDIDHSCDNSGDHDSDHGIDHDSDHMVDHNHDSDHKIGHNHDKDYGVDYNLNSDSNIDNTLDSYITANKFQDSYYHL
uniref:Sodium-dependent multivitamin transporter-like n=1 Tax=Saccoglossus kowalevskii TaxID=10224 RepID=A0ABM0GIQ7_SACKO|nr:PREDICTED: sodium-dependent multivitamin transporter-like [Saccoglossus kowalevskii]